MTRALLVVSSKISSRLGLIQFSFYYSHSTFRQASSPLASRPLTLAGLSLGLASMTKVEVDSERGRATRKAGCIHRFFDPSRAARQDGDGLLAPFGCLGHRVGGEWLYQSS